MTSIIQTKVATVPSTTNADQPSISSTAGASSAPLSSPRAVKAVTRRAVKATGKEATGKEATVPAKPAAQVAVEPVAKTASLKAAVKSVTSSTPSAATKAALKTPAEVVPKATSEPTAKPAEVKLLKAKKPKLVRDSFTIPKLEYLKLEELKHRSVKLGTAVKKSELIRAGIMALAAMTDANFMKATKAVPAIKTGRPAKD
jgi:hypothetical protein